MTTNNPYLNGLDKCAANYRALTPLSFLKRAASVYPESTAVIDGHCVTSWMETFNRCKKLASALVNQGVGKNRTVAILAPNSQACLEAHFAVPMAGAVLNAINTRLDAATIAFILEHGQADIFMVDAEYAGLAKQVMEQVTRKPFLVEIEAPGIECALDVITWSDFIESGDDDFQGRWPDDEWDAISLNYTSGTTGHPKGVVYHHRGAYLNALSNAIGWEMPHFPVYLWTLPMFHCNGWCFPWTLAAVAGASVCLRQVNSKTIHDAIAKYRVTHFCGAPIIMSMLINAADEERREFDHQVNMMTAAAPPPASVLEAMASRGFRVTHVYGLTETYGPAVICARQKQWEALDSQANAEKNARQGVPYHVLDGLDIMDPETMTAVARDGSQLGETLFQGNIVMKGYLSNPAATEQAFKGGWFHSGDLGVMHEDNYIELKDRSKDIIISGGENISSIEIENCLYAHPDIIEAAVVARPDQKWGESPCAFVSLAPGRTLTAQQVIDFCYQNLAHYKAPRHVVFCSLPKTSTGKIQKFRLRERALEL